MHDTSDFIDPVVRRAAIVEDRTWRGGIEIVSHVNYDQLARVRVALGVMPDACGHSWSPERSARRLPSEVPVPARPGRLELWTDIMAQICRVEEPAPLRLIA